MLNPVNGPAVIPSSKLLRDASVARSIPGLGSRRGNAPKKPAQPTSSSPRFSIRRPTVSLADINAATRSDLSFTFPEHTGAIDMRFLAATLRTFLLAGISLAVVRIPAMGSWLADDALWKRAGDICVQLVSRDLGLVLIWGVLVRLFRQVLNQTLSTGGQTRYWTIEGNCTVLSAAIVAGSIYLSDVRTESRLMLFSALAVNLASTAGWLAFRSLLCRDQDRSPGQKKNVLIVGAGNIGRGIADYLSHNERHGRSVKGFLEEDRYLDSRIIGSINDLAEVARAEFIDEIIVAEPHRREHARIAIIEAFRNHLDVRVVPELYGPSTPDLALPIPVLPLHEEPIPEFGLFMKRVMDVTLAAAVLVALAPVLALIAVLIRIDSPGPAFYRAARVGKKGRAFIFCKFRTMVVDADSAKDCLRDRNERNGPLFKVTADPRITKVGRFLRRYSLDELPQLWNVIRGDMSLVGPRPHPLDDYQRYALQHLRRLDVTPGITGLWQVTARRDPSFYKNMELDLEYIERWSLWLDIRILALTAKAVLTGTGA